MRRKRAILFIVAIWCGALTGHLISNYIFDQPIFENRAATAGTITGIAIASIIMWFVISRSSMFGDR